jgi:hypothetical protein
MAGLANHAAVARLAQKSGAARRSPACLLPTSASRPHPPPRYWAAQLLAPYVDEEVSWAIRYHQALRFYPDESVGYRYPELYVKLFGADYQPEPYIERDYRMAREHQWYMSSRLICVNDLYAFDPPSVELSS